METRLGIRRRGKDQVIRARGEILGKTELDQIRQFARRRKDRPLQETVLALCRNWNWRRPNGEWRESACTGLLQRLARRGIIRFPPKLHKRLLPRRKRTISRDISSQPTEPPPWPYRPHEGDSERSGALILRPILPEEKSAWLAYMARHHYLGHPNRGGETMRYVVFWKGVTVALLGWGAAALKCGVRDRHIGWDEATRIQRLHLVVNNLRFLIMPGVREKNLASRILGANLRRLSQDWEAAYNHPVYLAETFVDPQRFRGTCYRASNWIVLGETKGFSRQGAGYRHHGQKKLVLVYPLHAKARDLLRTPKPPIETQKEVKLVMIDVHKLPLEGKGGLFEVLQQLIEPRKPRGIRHPLVYILSIAACATLSGCKSFVGMAQWAAEVSTEDLLRLGCRRRKPPAESTIRRVLGMVGVQAFEEHIGKWFEQQTDVENRGVALDGKTLRGSADEENPAAHLVSLLTHEEGAVLAEGRVADKTNEITCVKPLLAPCELEGAVITADAMHTQKENGRYIVEEKKADYLFVVKGNQPGILKDIQLLDLGAFSPSGGNDRQRPRPAGDPSDSGQLGA